MQDLGQTMYVGWTVDATNDEFHIVPIFFPARRSDTLRHFMSSDWWFRQLWKYVDVKTVKLAKDVATPEGVQTEFIPVDIDQVCFLPFFTCAHQNVVSFAGATGVGQPGVPR